MEERVLKQMITAVDEVVRTNKSDFYKYDLHSLSDYNTPDFLWSVRETGTSLLVIDRDKMLRKLRENEQCRFSFMQHPNLALHSFLYFPGVKTFHYVDGVMNEVEHPNDSASDIWNDVSMYLQEIVNKEFGDKERKHWHSHMRVHFSTPTIWHSIYEAVHSEGGDSLLQILKSFRDYERGAVDEKIVIAGDWSPSDFSFYHERNGECIINGGILFYDGKWHRHT